MNTTPEDIAALLKEQDIETIQKVFALLKADNVFGGCANWTCQTKNHGEIPK